MTNIQDLPLEVLEVVMEHIRCQHSLHPCIFVNKRFYAASISTLWRSPRRIELYGLPFVTPSSIIACLELSSKQNHHSIPLGHRIRDLVFGLSDPVRDITRILTLSPLLSDLTLYSCALVDKDMELIARHCLYLTTIDLDSLKKITDKSIFALAHHCSRLRAFTLSNCRKLSPKALSKFKNGGLERLHIDICDWIHSEESVSCIRHFHELTYLTISQYPMNDKFLHHFLPILGANFIPLAQLTKFSIRGRMTNEDNALVTFIKIHPRLETLELRNCHVRPVILDAIAKYLPNLRHLSLLDSFNVSSQGVRQTIIDCPRLTWVDISGCRLPRRCFPETNPLSGLVGALDQNHIRQIRFNTHLYFTDTDDILTESEASLDG